MRRKSERTATKKSKASPERKEEKVKRSRTRRRKQSSSSENESDEGSPVRESETVEAALKEAPTTPGKEETSPEENQESQDDVWQVKTAETSGDTGEVQKLKICRRPSSTPERSERSPRSKSKHSRTTSSSDTPSSEGIDDKKRSRRSRRNCESRDNVENQDNQGDEHETEEKDKPETETRQSQKPQAEAVAQVETPMSTTSDEAKTEKTESNTGVHEKSELQNKSDADTTVASPKACSAQNHEADIQSTGAQTPERPRSRSVEKSEVLVIHAEGDDSKIEPSESELNQKNYGASKDGEADKSRDQDRASRDGKVSISRNKFNKRVSEAPESAKKDLSKPTNKNDVVESSVSVEKKKQRKISTNSDKEDAERNKKDLERSDSNLSTQEEAVHNGQGPPIVVNRKRKWGSRPKLTTQKSITISTDVLKEIIPDVKPAEFDEVIDEKKHKRIEMNEKIERPVLPKIIIDNTASIENRNDHEDSKENIKKEINLSANRRISIVRENDSILAPPSPPTPPRHQQSNILYITNLVRPFTLPQLKNLLQRTGRIVENGFWIDRIKSKCFVQYENEDQAVETRHALHGVTWPVSNPKSLRVDFSTLEAFEKARKFEETETVPVSNIPGTVEDWLREQDLKRERGELEKPWERKAAMREWDMGKNEKDKDKERMRRDERPLDKRRHRSLERSPEPARKFKKKEEEAPAKLLDDLFRKTKATPCIYWLPLSAETIAVKEEQRRQHMLEHERRLQELRRHRETRDRDRRH